jgi:membrane protein YqaA with SNARE-associated domain
MNEWPLKIYHSLMGWLGPFGGWALALIALMDSTFLSLPEVNDILIVTLTIKNPEAMLSYCALTTLGSVVGCYLLYLAGRKGGEVLIRKKLAENQFRKISNWYSQYGIGAVLVPSLLPPPTPFKIFVLFAGAFGISPWRFLLAVTIGRSLRYFAEGLLALHYGKQTLDLIRNYYLELAWILLGIVFTILITRFFWRKVVNGTGDSNGSSSLPPD